MKEIFVERREKLLRIAVVEGSKLIQCFIEEETDEPMPGKIYRGIVKNIIPALKCAFIDIGLKKECFMYMDRKFNNTNLKKNDEIILEVLKEAVGEKGPKVTNAISIPGRYVVLETLNKNITFSKKIDNESFKALIKKSIKLPGNVGIMVRTNAEKVPIEIIEKEVDKLYSIYTEIVKESKFLLKPKLLYNGEGILGRILRDILDEEVERIVVDNIEDYNYILDFLQFSLDIHCAIELFKDARNLFSYYEIENNILELRNNIVRLKEGGHIVIDKTEAMYVIDVNTGKNIKGSSMDKTIFNTNLEAAKEIGLQIKLRNLCGIIIIDFINMDSVEHKEQILKTLKEEFKRDKNNTIIYPFTDLNLVQISRQRRGRPINEYIEEACTNCKGKGKRIRLTYLTALIANEILRINSEISLENIYLELGSIYKSDIIIDIHRFIEEIGALDKRVYVNFTSNMEFFKIEPLIFQNHIENMQKFKIYG